MFHSQNTDYSADKQRVLSDMTYVLNTAKMIAEEIPSLHDMVHQDLANKVESAIQFINLQCAYGGVDGGSAVRSICHELQSMVKNARQYYGAVKDFVAKVPDKENIREIVQCQLYHQQPLEDLIYDLKQSLGKVKRCYSEFAYACSRAISEAGKAAEFIKVKGREAKKKKRIYQVVLGMLSVAAFVAAYVLFMKFTEKGGNSDIYTGAALAISSLVAGVGGAFTMVSFVDDFAESSIRSLQEYLVSLQSTIPNMGQKVKDFNKSLENIDHRLPSTGDF